MLKLRNHNIILPKYLEIVKKKGSSLTFSASGGRDKEKNEKPAEKITVGSEGGAERQFRSKKFRAKFRISHIKKRIIMMHFLIWT
ncbi:MAG: hypothetical protein A3H59_03850 [Candidatus Jacksonbacteria bacterium RIFCSPLOWO2_02_FULL_43_9]|nr:MAG: hypothetical protein A3B94_00130 [Candidatus Jacksonbacteria bacterium RIFCSPHIGHO2_02_FULL_43_10]OGY70836.1 MAG: hypothetical protein A2986_00660 [Candidatus Jacksonbacteria bacterium RIFCSPLOWO2_01_FULL_44_13]OGY72718.1 MAG: hypothetical protein A3H59_03850 [Candidatus Jacksonbacteria bacterium RIFCSPLOWO2_02_FULL_43_9]HAZ17081.1 hypothetical protein [Candidatus Jacksonbacteria bacterium]